MTTDAREIVERLLRGPTTDDYETAVAMHAAADFIKSLAAQNDRLGRERDAEAESRKDWVRKAQAAEARVAELEVVTDEAYGYELARMYQEQPERDPTTPDGRTPKWWMMEHKRRAAEAAAKEPRDD